MKRRNKVYVVIIEKEKVIIILEDKYNKIINENNEYYIYDNKENIIEILNELELNQDINYYFILRV